MSAERLLREVTRMARAGGGVHEVVRARAFQVVDDAGRVRAVLGMVEGSPMLALSDEAGIVRAMVSVVGGVPEVLVVTGEGRGGAAVRSVGGAPEVVLHDGAGAARASLSLVDGGATLMLSNAAGEVLALLGVQEEGPEGLALVEGEEQGEGGGERAALVLREEGGKVVWCAP